MAQHQSAESEDLKLNFFLIQKIDITHNSKL